MENLKQLTVTELQQLIKDCQTEIESREAAGNGFFKEYCINGKAYHPATYKQYEYAESLCKKTGSKIETTGSQVIKRMEMDDMSEAIDLMKEGKRIRIYQ